jgi:hypothetical protein
MQFRQRSLREILFITRQHECPQRGKSSRSIAAARWWLGVNLVDENKPTSWMRISVVELHVRISRVVPYTEIHDRNPAFISRDDLVGCGVRRAERRG